MDFCSQQIWDGLTDARLQITAQDYPELQSNGNFDFMVDPMSHLLENANLQRALLQSLEGRDSVELRGQTKVESISTSAAEGGWPVLQLEDGTSLRARLLVGADGINSPVRKFAGIDTHGWMYPTHGLVGTLEAEPPLSGACHTAFQRFLPTGPLAFLPVSPADRPRALWDDLEA